MHDSHFHVAQAGLDKCGLKQPQELVICLHLVGDQKSSFIAQSERTKTILLLVPDLTDTRLPPPSHMMYLNDCNLLHHARLFLLIYLFIYLFIYWFGQSE